MKRIASAGFVMLAVSAACSSGSRGDGFPTNIGPAGNSTAIDGGNTSPDSDGGGAGAQYSYPLFLTPLSAPKKDTANMSLYFSVVDANGKGVADLAPGTTREERCASSRKNFVVYEDADTIDPFESAFCAEPLSGSAVDIPTVLVLDLSNSVIEGGALPALKRAATTLIDGLLPEQRMAIITFADEPTVRQTFSADRAVLKTTIEGITTGDGIATNLYGAVSTALDQWQDGFQPNNTTQITAGLAIVITDGKDTAGVVTLADLIKKRRDKRVYAVGVGGTNAIDDEGIRALGNAGSSRPQDFAALEHDLGELTSTLTTLNRSIYQATYCSPKRAGTHELRFTVKGNEVASAATCTAAVFSGAQACQTPYFTEVCSQQGLKSTCCPASAPFTCPGDDHCHRTAEAAQAACKDKCVKCGGTGQSNADAVESGPAIRLKFAANGYTSSQCQLATGGQFQVCTNFNASCTAPQLEAYKQCYLSTCDAKLQQCYGANYKTKSFSGPCNAWITCVQGCSCSDTGCQQACGQPDSTCATCVSGLNSCFNDCGGSTCALPP